MIYNGPSIYNSGIPEAPIDDFAYVQENGTWKKLGNLIASSWVEINDKIGHIYQPILGGRVSFLYNKNIGLILTLAWINYGSKINSDFYTLFEFNNDLPGSQSNKLFTGTCPAITGSPDGAGFGTCRIIPNNDSDINISNKVTYEKKFGTTVESITCINYVLSVNSSLVDEFNAYLE